MNKLMGIVAVLVLVLGAVATAEEPWSAPERAKKKPNPFPAGNILTSGKRLYERECLSCHGRTGRGDGSAAKGLEVPPGDLTNAGRMNAQTDGELFWKITEGKKPMPTFKKALTDEERWQLVHYLRTLVSKEP